MFKRRLIIGLFLLALPVVIVHFTRRTSWAPALSAPQARVLGNPRAPVTIMEYSDFQCPSCASIQTPLHELLNRYDGKARLIFKYYPLTRIHPNAFPAAVAAECAALQNRFWPYHDRLFATQAAWGPLASPTTHFLAIAGEVGLDLNRFGACTASPGPAEVVRHDMEEAGQRQVNATPTFFVGEQRLVGGNFITEGARAIERELRR